MVIIRNPQNSVGSYFGPYLRVQGVGLYGLGFGLCGLELTAPLILALGLSTLAQNRLTKTGLPFQLR